MKSETLVKVFSKCFLHCGNTTIVEFCRYENYGTLNHASDGKQDQQIRHSRGLRCLIKKWGCSNATPILPPPCTYSSTISLQSYYPLPQDSKSAPLQRLFNVANVMSEAEG